MPGIHQANQRKKNHVGLSYRPDVSFSTALSKETSTCSFCGLPGPVFCDFSAGLVRFSALIFKEWLLLALSTRRTPPSPHKEKLGRCERVLRFMGGEVKLTVQNLTYSKKWVAYKLHAGWFINRAPGEFINWVFLLNLKAFSVEIQQKGGKV